MPALTNPILGIDLGTTNSLVAICDERGPRIIPDESGRALLPSVVRYERAAGVLATEVGHEARDRAGQFPLTTIASVKRLMGRSLADSAQDLAYLSYRVVDGGNDTARVELPLAGGPLVVSPPEVSAVILKRLKDQASRALGADVTRAVITVPAYFDDAQRQATRDAGRLAGLDVVRIVAEPTAAALAYGLGLERSAARNTLKSGHVVVYDLGGGTFDVSILKLTPAENDGDNSFFQVLATSGDTHLGGDDVDHMLVDLIASEHNLTLSPSARATAKAAAERAKLRLSEATEAEMTVEPEAGMALTRRVSRGEFESVIAPWVNRTLECCRRAVRDAAKRAGIDGPFPIDAVVMVGGSTRIPLVRRAVAEYFKLEPYTALDPDQVVALGAAVQAAVLSGARSGALLLDVIPLSLGIETVGGAVAKLVVRNSTVPTRATEMFSTSIDGQTSIKLSVYQGEREMAADCRKLGEFHLRGLPAMPAGIPQIEVEFLVDANGVLNVGAVEKRSGKRASLQVVPNHGLTRDEVDRMERESIAHAADDMTRHRVVDLITNSRLDAKWIGERLARYGALLDPPYRDDLARRVDELRALIAAAEKDWKAVDPNAFQRAKEELDRASVRLQEVGIAESLKSQPPTRPSG